LSDLNAKEFVVHVVRGEFTKSTDLAEKYFQNRDTEDAKKCMELLSLLACGSWCSKTLLGDEDGPAPARIERMFDRESVRRANFQYKEFCGDILYMAMLIVYAAYPNDGTLYLDMRVAELFRALSDQMYADMNDELHMARKHTPFELCEEPAHRYIKEIWPNWEE
jgi:hypothetical protein